MYNHVQYSQVQNYADSKKEIKHSRLYTVNKIEITYTYNRYRYYLLYYLYIHTDTQAHAHTYLYV